MGPTIILDKSSLQALSQKELILLNKLYFVNIPPVLIIEILADLKKSKEPNSLDKGTVVEIANKLIQKDNAVNVHYLNPVISSLLGLDYTTSRKTLVGGGKKVKDKNGRIGVQIIETPEQVAIRNWQRGDFTEAEKTLASLWRAHAREIDLEALKRQWLVLKTIYPECKDYKTLLSISEGWLNNEKMQSQFLFQMLKELNLDQEVSSKICYRWESGEYKLLKDFAPYFYFVSKVDVSFRLGLIYNMVTTRPTNHIDCEYIYYLPFCNIFSSRDNFHRSFATQFLGNDQTFIDGDELKADLRSIINILEEEDAELKFEWDNNFSIEPPDNIASLTYQMWKKYFPSWAPAWFYKKTDFPKRDSEKLEELTEEVNSFKELKVDPLDKFNDDEIDFISIEKQIRLDDQCICGSGKKFKECCYREGMKPIKE